MSARAVAVETRWSTVSSAYKGSAAPFFEVVLVSIEGRTSSSSDHATNDLNSDLSEANGQSTVGSGKSRVRTFDDPSEGFIQSSFGEFHNLSSGLISSRAS